MTQGHTVETVCLNKNKIKFQMLERSLQMKDLIEKLGIHPQTWAQRGTENTWPVSRAIEIAKFIGCKVSDIQSDSSMVMVRE